MARPQYPESQIFYFSKIKKFSLYFTAYIWLFLRISLHPCAWHEERVIVKKLMKKLSLHHPEVIKSSSPVFLWKLIPKEANPVLELTHNCCFARVQLSFSTDIMTLGFSAALVSSWHDLTPQASLTLTLLNTDWSPATQQSPRNCFVFHNNVNKDELRHSLRSLSCGLSSIDCQLSPQISRLHLFKCAAFPCQTSLLTNRAGEISQNS